MMGETMIADARNMTIDTVAPSQQEAYSHTNNGGGLVMQSLGFGRDAYNMGKGAQFAPNIEIEVQPPLIAKGPGGGITPAIFTSHGNYHTDFSAEVVGSLQNTDYKDPPTVGFYSQMKAECMTPLAETSPTLVNGTCPGFYNGVMESGYVVRRLLPTECARLQGFPDWWCDDLTEAEPDMDFWRGVWDTWCDINGKKRKTDSEILRWLKKPYSEAEEYKMWGNGVALPCVFFVMAGIAAWDEGKISEEEEELPLLAWFEEEEK
jgi:DNA (cytosine-5)-methyltransferase 1